MTVIGLFLLLIPYLNASTVCPNGTGPVFFVNSLSDKNTACFEECVRSEGCTGVVVSATSCISVRLFDYYGRVKENDFIKLHCVQDVRSLMVVTSHTDRVLLDHTEKISKAYDGYHCLSQCAAEKNFTCLSFMYYKDSGDCLLNNANSDSAPISKDTEGFHVEFMERRIPSDRPCHNSFRLLSGQPTLKGVVREYKEKEVEKCLLKCGSCSHVIFSEATIQCQVIWEDPQGSTVKVPDDSYMTMKSLCKHQNDARICPNSEALFIGWKDYSGLQQALCLESCLTTSNCRYAYHSSKGCRVTTEPMHTRATIEKRCLSAGKMETGVLFVESPMCLAGPGMKFSNIGLTQCMNLCVTHPTGSCNSVSYNKTKKVCTLLQSTDVSEGDGCQHFALNIVSLENGKNRITKKGPFKAFAATNGLVPKIADEKLSSFGEISVETVCHMNEVIIKASWQTPFTIFPRNLHSTCNESSYKGNAILRLSLNSSEVCSIKQRNGLAQDIVVIKTSFEANEAPLITEKDRLFSVTCDYRNQVTRINATRQLSLKSPIFHPFSLNGTVQPNTTIVMELKPHSQKLLSMKNTKKWDPLPPPFPITIGQPLELMFADHNKNNSPFYISNCIASSDDGKENVTLIVDGCPTSSAKDYIVRGGIKNMKNGFSIPIRAFKFRQGDRVHINCDVHYCADCRMPPCASRFRRNPPINTENEQLTTSWIVGNESLRAENFCVRQDLITFGSSVAGIVILVQIVILMIIFVRSRLQRNPQPKELL